MGVATSTDYITAEQLKNALRITNPGFDVELQTAVSASSRQIDNWYGDQFWTSGQLEQRTLRPDTPFGVHPGVFCTTEGLIVETDEDSDGVFETLWTIADYQAERSLSMATYPFDHIEAVGSRFFPGARRLLGHRYGFWGVHTVPAPLWGSSRRARVRVTAQWGWAAVPPEVSQACQILAIDHYKSKDLTNGSAGIVGSPGGGNLFSQAPFNPLAIKLLCHLKETVLA